MTVHLHDLEEAVAPARTGALTAMTGMPMEPVRAVASDAGDGPGDGGTPRVGAPKAPGAFRTISEVSSELEVPQHVLRFWETRFPQIKPLKRGGGRRYYRPADVDVLRCIQKLLYRDGYTIKGAQRFLREQRRVERDGESTAVSTISGALQEVDLFPDRLLPDAVDAEPVEVPPMEADAVEPVNGVTEPRDDGPAQHAELRAILAELEEIRRLLPTGALPPGFS